MENGKTKFNLEDVTDYTLKGEIFPGCSPAPLGCMPEGGLQYGKIVEKEVVKLQYIRYAECSPDDRCSSDYSYCTPD